ncbi:hypothetical protein ACQCVP_17400 [Rossellomorea vietnamensis]|uniref:hypothetical protein n=1 Tax=Rossellomorea vietnamensis TaxID=218284 RepID=UPI003CF9FED5
MELMVSSKKSVKFFKEDRNWNTLLRESGRQKDYFEKIIIESIMVLLKMPLNAL